MHACSVTAMISPMRPGSLMIDRMSLLLRDAKNASDRFLACVRMKVSFAHEDLHIKLKALRVPATAAMAAEPCMHACGR